MSKTHDTTLPPGGDALTDEEAERTWEWCEQTSDFVDDARNLYELRWAARTIDEEIRRRCFVASGYVYVLRAGDYCKIGRSKHPDSRLRQLAIQLPFPVEVVHVIPCEDEIAAEGWFHWLFADYRANGEWFKLTPEYVQTHIGFRYAERGGVIYRDGDPWPSPLITGRREEEK